jgi:hypothetical protein
VHGYYWNDDQPMMYFQDVRDRPRYCASHVVPLEELSSDLANPATTPNFAWVAPTTAPTWKAAASPRATNFSRPN